MEQSHKHDQQKGGHRKRAHVEKDLSFKVSTEFHQAFKTTAADYRVSMKALLEESFREWKYRKSFEEREAAGRKFP